MASFRVSTGCLAAMLAVPMTLCAQTNDEIFPTLEWNFSTPGARANGMGRTFIGIADDATAAVTNPARLLSLARPQGYFEFKSTRLRVDRLSTVSSLTTLQPTTFGNTSNMVSFVSVSTPVGSRIAVGFSINRFLDYDETFKLDARAVPNSPTDAAFRPVTGAADFTATAYSGSVAYSVTPALRLGATFGVARLDATSLATRYGIIFGPTYPANKTDLRGSDVVANQTSIDDSDIGHRKDRGHLSGQRHVHDRSELFQEPSLQHVGEPANQPRICDRHQPASDHGH